MRRIDEDIKSGQFKNLYLLYGTEDYLKHQYKKKLLDALVNPGDTMNFSVFRGPEAKNKDIVDLADTVPFLAKQVGEDGRQYRVILIEKSGFGGISSSKEKNDWAKNPADLILDYLKKIPETTIFIFDEEDKKVEKNGDVKVEGKVNRQYRLFKAAQQYDRDIEFKMPNPNVLQEWVVARLRKAGIKNIQKAAWDRFLLMTGDSMNNMDTELEKLISYIGDGDSLTVEDVNAVCIENVDVKTYEIADAMAEKNSKKVFEIYNELLEKKEEPRVILGALVALYRRLSVIKEMSQAGKSDDEIGEAIGTKGYYVKINKQRARRFSDKEIKSFLEDSADFLLKINTGLLNEKMAVELLMMKYAGEER